MTHEELIAVAAAQQQLFDNSTALVEKKERGHFGTPSPIARFMAEMCSGLSSETVRILDPGAGVGILSAALCQKFLAEETPREIFFELWENDPRLIPLLERTMESCQSTMRDSGLEMKFVVRFDDFILANSRRPLLERGTDRPFDLAILNPPYFKLRKESDQARAMEHVVHGQPNIYALFMAAAADLLAPSGEMVAITPRSYFNGAYFKRFRKWFFQRMAPRHIHVFESRKAAFKEDAVLQENVILQAQKGGEPSDILLTSSTGRDFRSVRRSFLAYEKTIDNSNGACIVRVPSTPLEQEILDTLDALPGRFAELGFRISTGPVVTFRATQFLRQEKSPDTAPLLWMHNVRPFITQFPKQNGKPAHIEVSAASAKLLVPSKTYVLLKRFTAKEEKRRLVAGIFTKADSYSPWIGLENHLNYAYHSERDLSNAEACGLAAYFNSAIVDFYFRGISGNTQVNATEIRAMPVPSVRTLAEIGAQLQEVNERRLEVVEEIVGGALGLPRKMIEQLVEAA